MKSCATCANYEPEDETCRGGLPQIIRRLENNYPASATAQGCWPNTHPTAWCAHHVPREKPPEAVGVRVTASLE